MPPDVTLYFIRAAAPVPLAWLFVLLFWFALPLDNRQRLAALLALLPAMWSLPLIVPPDDRIWRGMTAMGCSTLWLKSYDLHRGRCEGAPPVTLSEYLLFHLNPCSLVQRMLVYEPIPPTSDNVKRLLRGSIDIVVAAFLLQWAVQSSRRGWPFWLEHSVKATIAFALVYAASEIVTALWRLSGFRGHTVMTWFYLARTPAEFWRLYNRHIGQFLLEDMVGPMYRRIGPSAATFLAFLISGVWHEYMVSMAVGRVQLFMTGFFVLQGLGVAATYRLRPRGAWAVLGGVATLLFNLSTGLLYFASINQFIRWYSRGAPLWMRPH